jgi:hypothetical protein
LRLNHSVEESRKRDEKGQKDTKQNFMTSEGHHFDAISWPSADVISSSSLRKITPTFIFNNYSLYIMLTSTLRRTLRTPILRTFASGPAQGGEISDELLQRLGSLSTQALVDGLWVMGWPNAQINGARALDSKMKCVGRAVTLKFVPARPDIAQDKPAGGDSPEYEAFELCGPNEVSFQC